MTESVLPLGKLPPELLSTIIEAAPVLDERVIFGPGVGLDCAVLDMNDHYMVLKTDPITFATDKIGWYAVQINSNDIATTGAVPKWFMATILLPENRTDEKMVRTLSRQLFDACKAMNISFIGGHTEITYGIDRPIISGMMIGEVSKEDLITPRGIMAGDHILLTKGVPIEATAILAREFPGRVQEVLTPKELEIASAFLTDPGISVYKDAQIAVSAGKVTGMHDPTEGGLAAALWEMAEASGLTFMVDLDEVFIPELSLRICKAFNLNPFATIASGALLITASSSDSDAIISALGNENISCTRIGETGKGPSQVLLKGMKPAQFLPRPERDEITKVYE